MIGRFTVFCSILIIMLSLHDNAAQPGSRGTPEQIRKDLQDKIAEIDEMLINHPDRHWLHESRGKVLTDLVRQSQDPIERESLAKRAFEDFDRYEETTKGSAALSRAELHQLIWMNLVPDPKSSTLALDVEVFRHSPHFEAAVSVYLEMFRNQPILNVREMSEHEWVWRYYETAAHLYSFRASTLARFPAEVKAMNDVQLIWDDFDKAIELRKQSILRSRNIWFVANIFVSKGKAAYEFGHYQLALDSYQASDDYLAAHLEAYCKLPHSSYYCKEGIKNDRVHISLLRAKAYMKIGDYKKVVSNLDHYISEGPESTRNCAQLYRLRRQAHFKLRQFEKAETDFQTAATAIQGYYCDSLGL